jgi:hypothetical protein
MGFARAKHVASEQVRFDLLKTFYAMFLSKGPGTQGPFVTPFFFCYH